jgi:2,3-bisphosphoglycerate-independent phosphoglycerate mutase
MPHLHNLLGGPLVLDGVGREAIPPYMVDGVGRDAIPAHLPHPHDGARREAIPPYQPRQPHLALRALDACLGVPGLPQSATGQTALFTGVNAPALIGDHVAAHPTAPLREVIAEHSFLKRAAEAGASVLFANAHSEHFWQMVDQGKLRLGASTLTALAAGAPIPDLDDLLAGRAVLWDITHEIASGVLDYKLPLVPAEEAGARLARLAAGYDLVLYESFLPDLAGHRRVEPAWVLPRLDAFLGGILAHRPADMTLVVSSDHGNLEDVTVKTHTTNPVPLLVVGPAAGHFCGATAITDVAPIMLSLLATGGTDTQGPHASCPSSNLGMDHERQRSH